MAELDRPERITNITGLRAQSETPEGGAASVSEPTTALWPRTACRLCKRTVWVFAGVCACGMPSPGRDARAYYVARGAVGVAALGAVAWWALRR